MTRWKLFKIYVPNLHTCKQNGLKESYHSCFRPSHPDSPALRHTGRSPGDSVCCRHSDVDSSWRVSSSPSRPSGLDTGAFRHIPEPLAGSASRWHTGTLLQREGREGVTDPAAPPETHLA